MAQRGRPKKNMAREPISKVSSTGRTASINFGKANDKQKLFFQSRCLYTAYGGARGGGKSWAVRVKAVGGALTYPGIKILIVRRTYDEVRENHVLPIVAMVPPEIADYNGSVYTMTFANGSTIKFGHGNSYDSMSVQYQGKEYDWIFMDEATQFTEDEFRLLGGCLRGVNNFPKRFYLTCNPGGIGHNWVKRLFIDRKFDTDNADVEKRENPDDYCFIPATVEDNEALLNSGNDSYIKMLAALPENIRKAHRYGDWDALVGGYFQEFIPKFHTCAPFQIPSDWLRYRAFDYGLDMFACYWIAVSPEGRCYVYREFCKKNMIVRYAAQAIHENTLPGENITITFAPPDMWNRQKTDGKTMAEDFLEAGVDIIKANNNRVQGHLQIKQMLAVRNDGKPGLIIFDTCTQLIDNIRVIQTDEKNPSDCAKQPHDITHTVDALRYFCISRTLEKEENRALELDDVEPFEQGEQSYASFMCGGAIDSSYMKF